MDETPYTDHDTLSIETLPDNHHKGSVRVQVMNSELGILSSPWAEYWFECKSITPTKPGGVLGTVADHGGRE